MNEENTTPAAASDEHPANLPAYVADTLPAHEVAEVEDHIKKCAECRLEVKDLASICGTLRHFVGVDDSSSEVLFVEVEPGPPSVGKWKVAFWTAAAMLLVLISINSVQMLNTEPTLLQANSVDLLPASRNGASPEREGAVLRGEGPWVVNVLLPHPEATGEFKLVIEREGRRFLDDVVTPDAEGRVTLVVRSLAGPGEYTIRLEGMEDGDHSSFSYPLSVRY